jgi:hypothetical protein
VKAASQAAEKHVVLKGHDFRRATNAAKSARALQAAEKLVKYVSKRRIVSGHDFSRAANAAKSTRALQAAEKLVECVSKSRFVSGHDFSRASNAAKSTRSLQAAEKLVKYVSKRRIVSGHDFSRAVSAAKSMRPLGPAECYSGARIKSKPFSATCSVVPIKPCPFKAVAHRKIRQKEQRYHDLYGFSDQNLCHLLRRI